ncbi:MAG: winged helix-turn-helix transcriptional regulator [Gemmatimonadaceae bacterium]|nr:winged helix-turn-helix transcriptional regulator [Gemmatimonadaceae bacterium]
MHPLDALGNPTRREILRRLRYKPLSVQEIADGFPVSRPAISRHLSVLEATGLVDTTSVGTRNVYSVRVQGFQDVRAYLDEFWSVALARLEALDAT